MEIWNADRDTLLAELHTRLGAVVEGRYEQTVETRTRRRDRIKVVGIFHLATGDEEHVYFGPGIGPPGKRSKVRLQFEPY